jgi:topoisomerase-4 subunit A
MHRALPDARDGLKPVHRRILFAMRALKLDAKGVFRKCAKIVGEVMGNYHPHGDKAIYDALARLAQDFSVRYPLVDGQGNFGNIDGDNPAAQRYTEARLTKVSEFLLDGLSEDSVDFRDNYDGSEQEPVVLPAGFPQLLANGSSGIAVGMATNIPPHNLGELCEALIHLIKFPNAREETLLDIIPGPDFPTGGVIVEDRDHILENYKTGRGSFRLRAKYFVEELNRGGWQIVVTEIPFQIQKSKLIEKIAELINEKKISILSDVRDESDAEIRLIFEPRSRTVDPTVLMESLFKTTDLEIKFSLNMNVLIDGQSPKVCSLKEVLNAFLIHRLDVLIRISKFRLQKIDSRLEILEGYIVAFLNLDRVIEIIRNEDNPKLVLINDFDLFENQAEAILNMRLRSLRKLEELELKRERESLWIERVKLEDLIENKKLQWQEISKQLINLKKIFGNDSPEGSRRTTFGERTDVDSINLDSLIEKEPVTIVFSKMGWIRAMRGHLQLDGELKYRDGDGPKIIFHANTADKILAMGSNGRCYTILAKLLPGGRSLGEPVRIMIDLPNDSEIIELMLYEREKKVLLASNVGNGFLVKHSDLEAQTKNGKQILNISKDERLLVCSPVKGDYVASIGDNRKLLIFSLDQLPEMSRGKGIRFQKFKDGDLSDARIFYKNEGLSWTDPANRVRTELDLHDWIGKRASAGSWAPRGFPKDNKFN